MFKTFRLFNKRFNIFPNRKTVSQLYSHSRYFHQTDVRSFPIESVNITKNELVHIIFSNNVHESFPWHFLQDNCVCDECFDSASQSRKKRMTSLDLTKKISSVQIVSANNSSSIKILWSDGHEGIYSESWLLARSFSKANQQKRKLGFRDRIQLVGSDYKIKRLRFQEVLDNDELLLECLEDLCKYGVVLLTDAPKATGQLRKLADKIGFIRTTHYGNEFTVRSIVNAVNLAYSNLRLNVHTDLPYYAYPPGVQMLHCIKQFYGEKDVNLGGESHLVDGFNVAEYMRKNLEKHYDTLCNTDVEFYDIGQDYVQFHKIHHSPTFVKCPVSGNLTRIVYSNQQLSSYLPIDVDTAQFLYKALKSFTDLCYDDRFLMKFKLNEGEILVFDNWRFLHGRSEFDPTKGERHLEGCYVDWDEVFSRIRVISSNGR